MSAIKTSLSLVCAFCGFAVGAGEGPGSAKVSDVNPERLPTVSISVPADSEPVDANADSKSLQRVKVAERFFVSTVFAVKNPEEYTRPTTTIKVVVRGRDGKPVIANSATGSVPVRRDDGKFECHGKIKAPLVPGAYAVQIWAKGKMFAETKIEVQKPD